MQLLELKCAFEEELSFGDPGHSLVTSGSCNHVIFLYVLLIAEVPFTGLYISENPKLPYH